MKEKLLCPECHQREIEQMNACGASNYFCNHCKKVIASKKVEAINPEASKE